ncbi:MAG: Bug family tripartite tricarboxylate transporter substrate binding protein, partial [Microthrixaceae bacterium]
MTFTDFAAVVERPSVVVTNAVTVAVRFTPRFSKLAYMVVWLSLVDPPDQSMELQLPPLIDTVYGYWEPLSQTVLGPEMLTERGAGAGAGSGVGATGVGATGVFAGGVTVPPSPLGAEPVPPWFPEEPLRVVPVPGVGAALSPVMEVSTTTVRMISVVTPFGLVATMDTTLAPSARPSTSWLNRPSVPTTMSTAPLTRTVAPAAVAPYVLAINASIPAKTVQELVTYAKAQSEPLKMGNAGVGSLSDMAALLFGQRTGVKVLSVPFKGTHPARIALESGECPAMVATYVTFPGGIQSGKVRVLAVAAGQRLGNVPDIPTFAEAGLPGLEIQQW